MKIIQPHTDPVTGTSSTLVGIIRGTNKEIYTDFIDGQRYIKAWHRVSYLHAMDERPIWLDVVFRVFSCDQKIIERIEIVHIHKKGDLVLCQNHDTFPCDADSYTIEKSPTHSICENVKRKSEKTFTAAYRLLWEKQIQ